MSRYAGGALGIDIAGFMPDGPNFGAMGTQGIQQRAKNQAASFGLSAELANAGMNAIGLQHETKNQIRGMNAEADAARYGQMANTISAGVGSLVGAVDFDSMFKRGAPAPAPTKPLTAPLTTDPQAATHRLNTFLTGI